VKFHILGNKKCIFEDILEWDAGRSLGSKVEKVIRGCR
jgi:hypothetical protein